MSAERLSVDLASWDFAHIFRDIPGAVAAAGAALEDATQAGDERNAARAHLVLGTAQTYLDQIHDAEVHLASAMRLFKTAGMRELWLTSVCRYALVLLNLGRLREAIHLLDSNMPEVRALPDRRLLIEYLNILRGAAVDSGDWNRAIEHLSEAQQHATDIGWIVGRLWTAINLASVYVNLLDMDSAIITADDALQLIGDDPRYQTYASHLLVPLAEAQAHLGNIEEAIRLHGEAVRIATATHDLRSAGTSLLTQARLRESIGDIDGALASYRQVATVTPGMPATPATPGEPVVLAESDLAVMAQWGVESLTDAWTWETTRAIEQMIADNRPSDIVTQVRLHDALARSYVGLGDLQSACRQYTDCVSMRDRLFQHALKKQVVVAASAAQMREARLHATEERRLREEADRVLRQLQLLHEENTALIQQLQHQSTLLAELSRTDALTGLANRRSFDDRFQLELNRRAARPAPLLIALADIDNFKQINDQWSHGIGDQVLRQVADLMAEVTRDTDLLARYGGEEFVLLFSGTSADDASTIAERVRATIAAHDWTQIASDLRVTISIGLYTTQASDTPGEMLAAADRLLYRAKALGRNRVEAG